MATTKNIFIRLFCCVSNKGERNQVNNNWSESSRSSEDSSSVEWRRHGRSSDTDICLQTAVQTAIYSSQAQSYDCGSQAMSCQADTSCNFSP